MKHRFLPVKDMLLCAIFAGLMALCAWISVPVLQIGFTLQTFALFFVLGLLGGKRGTISCLVYMLLGGVGLPVFSGFRGGVGVLFGATGGYIWGFLAAALVYWAVTAAFGQNLPVRLFATVLGLAACYACGTGWYLYAYGGSLGAVLGVCVVPYLLPDGIKIALALYLSGKMKQLLKI